jgi:hypothetical protein
VTGGSQRRSPVAEISVGRPPPPPPPSWKMTNFRKFWPIRGLKTAFSSANGGGGFVGNLEGFALPPPEKVNFRHRRPQNAFDSIMLSCILSNSTQLSVNLLTSVLNNCILSFPQNLFNCDYHLIFDRNCPPIKTKISLLAGSYDQLGSPSKINNLPSFAFTPLGGNQRWQHHDLTTRISSSDQAHFTSEIVGSILSADSGHLCTYQC